MVLEGWLSGGGGMIALYRRDGCVEDHKVHK